ncbi:MAG TPA: DMT family transporter [Gaiellaceae bacterium]|nr:DMT family transporter [Gaiellaceae bacterium]
MTAIALGLVSAFLFGAMTIFVRIALRTGVSAEAGSLYTIVPAAAVTFVAAAVEGSWDLVGAWPFFLGGLLAPGVSQILFTFAVRDAGASRTSVTVGTAPLFAVAIAFVFLDEPVVAGLVVGAALIVVGAVLLASERTRPEHFRRVGLLFALLGTMAFAARDNLVRWLGTQADAVEPGMAALATMAAAVAATVAFVLVTRTRLTRAGFAVFLPAAACYGLSYVLLFEAFYRGRVSVVSPIVATESLWGVTLSWLVLRKSERVGPRLLLGAALVVIGGILIGIYR